MSHVSLSPVNHVHVAPTEAARPVVVWAVGELRAMSERERRLTAVVLAEIPGVLDFVLRERRLPAPLPGGGRELSLRRVVTQRGLDCELSASERAVLDALDAGDLVPSERAVVLDGRAL